MAKKRKSPSRLRQIFGILRAKGKLLKQSYKKRSLRKIQGKIGKIEVQHAKINKQTLGGLTALDKKDRQRLVQEIQLMKQIGLWKENPTKEERMKNIRELYAVGVLEQNIRKEIEEEYSQCIE